MNNLEFSRMIVMLLRVRGTYVIVSLVRLYDTVVGVWHFVGSPAGTQRHRRTSPNIFLYIVPMDRAGRQKIPMINFRCWHLLASWIITFPGCKEPRGTIRPNPKMPTQWLSHAACNADPGLWVLYLAFSSYYLLAVHSLKVAACRYDTNHFELFSLVWFLLYNRPPSKWS